jgi:TatD DNase family protein
MIELFDTHAHFEGTCAETGQVLERAAAAGVTRVMAVGGSAALNSGVDMASKCGIGGVKVWRCIGWDRDQAGKDLPELDYSGVAAVGEIGLDYHYSPETRKGQMDLMARQLELARSLDLPVVIHTRDADDDTLGLLRDIPSRGIIHCFTGGPKFCRELLDLGFMISISGIVTFRAAENVRESALVVPDDRILVETDSPFLAPVPLRGNANEPAFVVHTAKFLAELRKTPFEAFAELTVRNALKTLGKFK